MHVVARSGASFQDEVTPSNTSIAIPSLKWLKYEVSQHDGELLRFLHVPALEELTLLTGASPLEIQSCFLSSRPPLTALRFSSTFWLEQPPEESAATMGEILQMVPTLGHLSMEFPRQGHPDDMEELDIMYGSRS